MKRRINVKSLLIWIGIIAVALGVNFALIFTSPERMEESGESTYSASKKGSKALYLALKKSGYSVSRKETSLMVPPPTGAVFVSLAPREGFGTEETVEFSEWIKKGGVAIIGADSTAASLPFGFRLDGSNNAPFPNRSTRGDGKSETPKRLRLSPAAFSPVPDGVVRLIPPPDAFISETETNTIYLLDSDDGLVAAERRYGKGRVLLFTCPDTLSNENLLKADNLRLFLNMLESAGPDKKIVFDEYRHGFTKAEFTGRAAFLRLLVTTPYGLCALLLGFCGVLWLLNRDTIAIKQSHNWIEKPSAVDHLEAVAALYGRMNANSFAAWRLVQTLRRELVESLALPYDTPSAQALKEFSDRGAQLDAAARDRIVTAENKLLNGELFDAAGTLALARSIESIRKELHK